VSVGRYVVGLVVAVAAGLLVANMPGGANAVVLPLVLVALACLLLGVYSGVVERDALAPLSILSVLFLIVYVLRPIYVLSSGRIGPTRAIDDRWVSPEIVGYMERALWLVLLALASLFIGYVLHRARGGGCVPATVAATETGASLSRAGTTLAVAGAVVVSALAYVSLIREVGGVAAYLSALSLRSDLFFGRGYLAVAALPLKAVTLTILAVVLARGAIPPRARWAIGGLIAIVLVSDFLTGGRAALILGTVVPVLLILHRTRRNIRLKVLVPVLAIVVVVFVGMRVVTRDVVHEANRGKTRTQLVTSALMDLPADTVGGRDAVLFDSLTRLVEAEAHGSEILRGRTYAAILTFPVPRAIWAGKPLGGGNAWFTSTYYPNFYGQGNVETSISLLGESYANFGPAGVVVVFFLFGWVLSTLYARMMGDARATAVPIYAVTFAHLIQIVRGDAFHAVTSWAMIVVLLLLARPMIVRQAGFARGTRVRPTAVAAG